MLGEHEPNMVNLRLGLHYKEIVPDLWRIIQVDESEIKTLRLGHISGDFESGI